MRRAAGFTLIEVICVLAIIALLASLVLPAIPRATSRARLEAYALEVASLLTADRTAAIRRRAEITTALDASARVIRSGAGAGVYNYRATSPSTRCSPKHAMAAAPARRSRSSPVACPAEGPSSCGAEISAIRFASIGSREGLRLFRSTLRPNSRSRGFTLVEFLVALTVMMIVLSAIAGLSASSLRTGRYVERHLADVENVQQIFRAAWTQ